MERLGTGTLTIKCAAKISSRTVYVTLTNLIYP